MLTSSSSSSINCNNLTNADNEIVSFILWPRNIERDIEKITGHWDPLLSMISEGEPARETDSTSDKQGEFLGK